VGGLCEASLRKMVCCFHLHGMLGNASLPWKRSPPTVSDQFHHSTYTAEELAAKLSGEDYTIPPDDVSSYAKARSRIERARDALNGVEKEEANRIGETMTSVRLHDIEIEVPIKAVATHLLMTNIHFHASMAYAILRKEGVSLRKRDWTRGFVSEYL